MKIMYCFRANWHCMTSSYSALNDRIILPDWEKIQCCQVKWNSAFFLYWINQSAADHLDLAVNKLVPFLSSRSSICEFHQMVVIVSTSKILSTLPCNEMSI